MFDNFTYNATLTELRLSLSPRYASGGKVALLNSDTLTIYHPCTAIKITVSNAQKSTMYVVGEKKLLGQ